MKAKLLVAMTGAAALLIGAALPPAANAQSVDCEAATADLAAASRVTARERLLGDYIAEGVPTNTDQLAADATFRMVCRAEQWATDGLARGGDLNPKYPGGTLQPVIDVQDAEIMFYVMSFIDDIGADTPRGESLRNSFIADRRGTDTNGNPAATDNDGEFRAIVGRAVTLLCQTDPAGTAGAYANHALCNSGG